LKGRAVQELKMSDQAVSPEVRSARDLRRAQTAATGLLMLMVVLFAAAAQLQSHWPMLAYLRAFSEAGIAGACADWFAVTALFRRPFGLPIPHTAIIPRNKNRIGEAMGRFIAENFLNETVLQEKLRNLEVGRWGGAWLRKPSNARRLAIRIALVLPDVVAAAPKGAIGELGTSALLAALRAAPAGPATGRILTVLSREGYLEAAMERTLVLAADYLARNKMRLRDQVAADAGGWMTRWLDSLLFGRVLDGLVRTLEEMRAPDHPLRRDMRAMTWRWIRRLRTDPELQRQAERFKTRLLSHPALSEELTELQEAVEARIAAEIAADPRRLAMRLERALQAFGDWLAQESPARDRLNAWVREVATGVIAPRRNEIGRFVAEVVAAWDARSVTQKLELQVGKDLQFIRINGTLVGGFVGLSIYALARATGLG
jgi:uncharacterized membrane-anchored protein YjiN (DUF445 family)